MENRTLAINWPALNITSEWQTAPLERHLPGRDFGPRPTTTWYSPRGDMVTLVFMPARRDHIAAAYINGQSVLPVQALDVLERNAEYEDETGTPAVRARAAQQRSAWVQAEDLRCQAASLLDAANSRKPLSQRHMRQMVDRLEAAAAALERTLRYDLSDPHWINTAAGRHAIKAFADRRAEILSKDP